MCSRTEINVEKYDEATQNFVYVKFKFTRI